MSFIWSDVFRFQIIISCFIFTAMVFVPSLSTAAAVCSELHARAPMAHATLGMRAGQLGWLGSLPLEMELQDSRMDSLELSCPTFLIIFISICKCARKKSQASLQPAGHSKVYHTTSPKTDLRRLHRGSQQGSCKNAAVIASSHRLSRRRCERSLVIPGPALQHLIRYGSYHSLWSMRS